MADKFISPKGCVLLFSEETTYGTAVTPARPIGIVKTWSVDEKKGVVQTYGNGSSTMQALSESEYDVSGSFGVALQRSDIIEYFLGAPTETGEGPFVHTITAVSEAVKSVTLGLGLYDANTATMLIRNQITGVRIKKFEIVCTENNEVMLNLDWEGQKVTHDTTSMAAAWMTGEKVFSAKSWTFKIAAAGGTTAQRKTVTNCTITMNRDVAKAWGNGDNVSLFKDVDKFTIKVTGSEFFTDKTVYEDFQGSASTVGLSQTAKKIELEISNGLSTTSLRKVNVILDNCIVSGGFKMSQPSTTSFVKTSFAYDGFLSSYAATDNTANWNA